MKNNFGSFLRKSREKKGITLRKFAQLVDKSPTYICKIERGELNPPSEKTIIDIAYLLDVDEDKLLLLANKIPQDVLDVIKNSPPSLIHLIRGVGFLNKEEKDLALKSLLIAMRPHAELKLEKIKQLKII
jgi:transcriptional regulator with XRE-family HTH domain